MNVPSGGAAVVPMNIEEPIPELDQLHLVLSRPEAQRGLVRLYADSQAECTRNGACGMEIGMAREKDQGAVLKMYLGDAINLDLDNQLTEDYRMGGQNISAKHSCAKIGAPVKVKWTSADQSVEETLEALLKLESYPHLLLTYLDIKAKRITIVCVDAAHHRRTVQAMGKEAFSVPKGNSRGIEYSRPAMKRMMEDVYFRVEFEGDLTGGTDPIERRLMTLRSLV
jgi:hypothetical protein